MQITRHAQERIIERGITTAELVECVKNGKRLVNRNDPNKVTIVLNGARDVYMVTDKEQSVLITAFVKEK